MKIKQSKITLQDYALFKELDSLVLSEVLTFDILIKKDNGYVIIMEAGTVLTEGLKAKLKRQTSLYISTKNINGHILTCKSLNSYIEYNKDDLIKRVDFLYKINNDIFQKFLSNTKNKINVNCVISVVESIIFLIKYDKSFLKNTIPNFKNEYDFANHSLHVSIYALNIGHKLNLDTQSLINLGTASLLKDIGYKKIDDELLLKNDLLSESEIKEIQKHSRFSVEIARLNNVTDSVIIEAILHHHEQENGQGYPDELSRSEVSNFAVILFICDVFAALTSIKLYRAQYSSYEAIKYMMKDPSMADKFNGQYLKIFLKSL